MNLLESLFNGTEITEEFKSKVETLFEAAVNEKVDALVAEKVKAIEETFDRKLEEAKETFITEKSEILESFIDAAVSEWANENSQVLDDIMKVQIAESFLDGLRNLFVEHNVQIPDTNTVSIIESLQTEIVRLQEENEKLAEQGETVAEALESFLKADIVSEATINLSDIQADRVSKICEAFEFNSKEDFAKKVSYVVEGITGVAGVTPPIPDQVPEDKTVLGFLDPQKGYTIPPAAPGGATTGTTQGDTEAGVTETVIREVKVNPLVEATLNILKKK